MAEGKMFSRITRKIYRSAKNKQQQCRIADGVILAASLIGKKQLLGEVNGIPLYISPTDNWGLRAFFLGPRRYDENEISAVTSLADDHCVFWDIGANYGVYTLCFLRNPDLRCRIIAVEPSPKTFLLLKKSCELNGDAGRVSLENVALSDHEGEGVLYLSSINSGDNRIIGSDDNAVHNRGRGRKKTPIRITTLDALAKKYFGSFPKRNVLKLDVQGAELLVLKGARELIGASDYFAACVEVWPHGLEQAGADVKAFYDFCEAAGLRFYGMDRSPVSYSQLLDQLNSTNHRTTNAIIMKGDPPSPQTNPR